MTFDETGICVLESVTTIDECRAYLHFLTREKERHYRGQQEALGWADWHHGLPGAGGYHHAVAEFYYSAARRHKDDLDAIDKTWARIEAHKAKLEAQCK
jgi:hypothetical protein